MDLAYVKQAAPLEAVHRPMGPMGPMGVGEEQCG